MKTEKIAQPTEKTKSWPVVEIFGPTIQGEGALIGRPTLFVRFGGCDYRCSWCDSLYAVLPEKVRHNSIKMSAEEILGELQKLNVAGTEWVTLSGGNPALFDLSNLVHVLHRHNYKVAVETQGSVWKDWLRECDLVTVSPKPPSSGMVTDWEVLDKLYFQLKENAVVKVVVFDNEDLDYARTVARRYTEWDLYLQVGNDVGEDNEDMLLRKLDWLVKTSIKDPVLKNAVVLPQLHVLLWGNARGV